MVNIHYGYGCDFCEAVTESGDIGKTNEFDFHVGDSLASRTIFDSPHFVIIATLGPIVEGHILALSKEHYPSMAHLPYELFEELELVCFETGMLLSQAYASPIIFEHGPMPLGKYKSPARGGGSCVDHAHFHFVPLSVPQDDIVATLGAQYPSNSISTLSDLRSNAVRGMPYLFFQNLDSTRHTFDAPLAPRQYLRSLLAKSVGEPEKGNWRIYPEPERLIATVRTLKNFRRE